jgi:hypothetical protein
VITAGIVVLFAGYAIGSYGVVLLRGYDITWKQWISPLNPYPWPKGTVPSAGAQRVFP